MAFTMSLSTIFKWSATNGRGTLAQIFTAPAVTQVIPLHGAQEDNVFKRALGQARRSLLKLAIAAGISVVFFFLTR